MSYNAWYFWYYINTSLRTKVSLLTIGDHKRDDQCSKGRPTLDGPILLKKIAASRWMEAAQTVRSGGLCPAVGFNRLVMTSIRPAFPVLTWHFRSTKNVCIMLYLRRFLLLWNGPYRSRYKNDRAHLGFLFFLYTNLLIYVSLRMHENLNIQNTFGSVKSK